MQRFGTAAAHIYVGGCNSAARRRGCGPPAGGVTVADYLAQGGGVCSQYGPVTGARGAVAGGGGVCMGGGA